MGKSPFWINDVYGLGYWLKDYAYYPQGLPLFCYSDHGMTLFDTIPPHELDNDAPVIFKFSPRLVTKYKEVSDKPVYCLLNPTIHCRKSKGIEKTSSAKGTLFFPAHSTSHIDDETNWEEFISDIDKLGDDFHPVDICLHHWDMEKGLAEVFISRGYKVVSAGTPYSNHFPERMYDILKQYRFTMSNLPGSYTFYSVEMGIPFSLYGKEPVYNNRSDENVESGRYTSYVQQPTYKKALELFGGLHREVSDEQERFVNYELGKYNTISRLHASRLLYGSFFKYIFSHPSYLRNVIKTVLKK